MKKDIYPDVRIEIISEGLTKKILESSESPAPVVYGEEQPEGKNLPNVGIKGKNKELQSVLETSNKKPTYTGLVKEAVLELRKDNQNKYAVGSDKRELTAPGAMTGPDFGAQRKRKNTPTIYRGTGFRGRETDAPLMDEDRPQDFMRRRGTPIAPQASTSKRGLSADFVDRGDQALSRAGFSTGTTRESTTVQGGKIGDIQPALTEAGFGRGASQEAKQSIPMRTVADKSKKESARMRGPSSIGSGRLEEAMVKEAIFELRKQPEGQYGQFQPGGVPKKTKDEAAAKRIASTIGTTSPQSAALQSAPTSESKKYSTELTGQTAGVPQKKTTTETVENVRGTMTGTPDETAPGMPGAGGVRRLYSVESKPKGFDSTDVSQIAATSGAGRKGIQARADFDPADIGSMGAPTRAATSAEVAEREKGKDTGAPTETTKLVGRPDVDEDVIEGRSSGTLPPDTSNENLVVGGPDDGGLKGEDDKINTAATSATATGFTPTKDRPAIPETEQTIKNNRAGTPAPLINSSGYYSAVVQIGELTAENATAEQRNLALKNYGVKSLSEFLDLYKAVTPKSITAKPKANVTGVNMSSTVVSGAGTMQKGKIKAERSVPARTRPKKRVPKLIKSERPAMDNTLKYIIKEALEEFKLDKAALEKQKAPSTFSSKRQAYRG